MVIVIFHCDILQIANAVNTAASTGADLNGGAVKNACATLRRNLEIFLSEEAEKPECVKSELLQHWKRNGSWYKSGGNGYNYWPEVHAI